MSVQLINQKKIKICLIETLANPYFNAMAIPFLKKALYKGDLDWLGGYEKLAHNYFEISDINTCNYVITDCQWKIGWANFEIIEAARIARMYLKKIIIFVFDDSTEPICIENAIVFRTSLDFSKKQQNEYPFPAFPNENFVDKYCREIAAIDSITETPIVGFCGNIDNKTMNRKNIKSFIKNVGYELVKRKCIYDVLLKFGIHLTKHTGRIIRNQVIYSISREKHISKNFIIRDKFFNGTEEMSNEEKVLNIERSRIEYCKNILDSVYVLCPRGGGNFSYRLYETMSLSRIPIIINTDIELPYQEFIDWKGISVWIEEKDISAMGTIILDFHRSKSKEQLLEIQCQCRKIWEEYLSPNGFFKNIHLLINPTSLTGDINEN